MNVEQDELTDGARSGRYMLLKKIVVMTTCTAVVQNSGAGFHRAHGRPADGHLIEQSDDLSLHSIGTTTARLQSQLYRAVSTNTVVLSFMENIVPS